jgi:protein-L-isoaspartate(D-aspartate) O-methyltransferase
MLGTAGALVAGLFPAPARANVPVAYDWTTAPPTDGKSSFVDWMTRQRGENPGYLGQRWDRLQALLARKDVWDNRDIRAYLLTPREELVTPANLGRAYEWHYLSIGFGVTITGPHTVARMTNSPRLNLSPLAGRGRSHRLRCERVRGTLNAPSKLRVWLVSTRSAD